MASADYEDLLLLSEVDHAGRVPGAHTSTIDEAIEFLKGFESAEQEAISPPNPGYQEPD